MRYRVVRNSVGLGLAATGVMFWFVVLAIWMRNGRVFFGWFSFLIAVGVAGAEMVLVAMIEGVISWQLSDEELDAEWRGMRWSVLKWNLVLFPIVFVWECLMFARRRFLV